MNRTRSRVRQAADAAVAAMPRSAFHSGGSKGRGSRTAACRLAPESPRLAHSSLRTRVVPCPVEHSDRARAGSGSLASVMCRRPPRGTYHLAACQLLVRRIMADATARPQLSAILAGEGDRYFERVRDHTLQEADPEKDPPLRMIATYDLHPRKCSRSARPTATGWQPWHGSMEAKRVRGRAGRGRRRRRSRSLSRRPAGTGSRRRHPVRRAVRSRDHQLRLPLDRPVGAAQDGGRDRPSRRGRRIPAHRRLLPEARDPRPVSPPSRRGDLHVQAGLVRRCSSHPGRTDWSRCSPASTPNPLPSADVEDGNRSATWLLRKRLDGMYDD